MPGRKHVRGASEAGGRSVPAPAERAARADAAAIGIGVGVGAAVIKRYANRKLYAPAARRYVTLEELARRLSAGDEWQVVDQSTGEDLTQIVLAQILLEGLKDKTARIPRQVLVRLIRLGRGAAPAWAEWLSPHDAAARARQEAERIAGGLMTRGRLSLEDALALRQDLSSVVQRIVADAQRGIERRIHGLLERSEADVGSSLHSLKERLVSLETFLASPPPAARRRARRSGRNGTRAAASPHTEKE
jgi:polyhydroxyalkanoate synthesis repressor PhaR